MLTNILTTLLAVFLIGYGLWLGVGLIRYIRSGDYDTDKRLSEIRR